MSVRLFKIGTAVFLMHAAVLTLIWVGFSVPPPSASAVFMYGGAIASTKSIILEGQGTADMVRQEVIFDPFEASSFQPWIGLRAIEKPTGHSKSKL